MANTCSIDGCDNPARTRGWCDMHYRRWRKHGDPHWKPCKLSLEDKFWRGVGMGARRPHMETPCWEWTRGKSYGYGAVENQRAHRVSYELHSEPIPQGLHVDHRCHNRGCVRPDHLRVVTQKQNQENRSGPDRDSLSGVRGVHWNKGRWQAKVIHNGRAIHVGRFKSLEAAAQAVSAKRNELFSYSELDRKCPTE